ncbi:plasmid mobilization relaxosome protein MobC [Streptomyces alboniger]|uniref:Plasmid mobilization relaxosome protein MobC n=1 Tax=Streptomyces alboniger TaxID=132473 RepID=A0A5J6HQG7_STRAD|nr:plasmid mobilization relaxosome protein MobC [Streptomyces alboniger]
MHDPHHEPLATQQQTTATPVTRAASCRVRSPYPAPAPQGTEASGAEGAPESAGPGEPTETGTSKSSSNVPQKPVQRRRLRDKQLREHRVHPRYNDNEFALVKNAAALSEMAAGGYVAECSLAAARADDPTASVADYRAMVKTLMAANGKLGQIGNNLNQLTWHLHKDGAWPHPDTVQRLLDRVEASIAELDTAVAQVTEGR